jgi:hypothetical protein
MRCRSQTNFLRWQEWSVQFEWDSALLGKFRRLINNATEPSLLNVPVSMTILARS